MKNYGKVTIGHGSPGPVELQMIDFVKAEYKDHRLISVVSLEDSSIILQIENPVSTGRSPQQLMRVSLESLVGISATIALYFEKKKMDMNDILEKSLNGEEIQLYASDNLK